jgi:hypothetical protein
MSRPPARRSVLPHHQFPEVSPISVSGGQRIGQKGVEYGLFSCESPFLNIQRAMTVNKTRQAILRLLAKR